MNALFARISPVVAAATLAIVGTATAADVNMTGWQTWGGIAATANSSTTIAVPEVLAKDVLLDVVRADPLCAETPAQFLTAPITPAPSVYVCTAAGTSNRQDMTACSSVSRALMLRRMNGSATAPWA